MQSEIDLRGVQFAMPQDDCEREALRQIRNSCREFMTRDNHEITEEEQVAWWAKIDHKTCIPLLLTVKTFLTTGGPLLKSCSIGYGLLRKEGERWWLSGGLLPQWRGQGWGTALFTLLLLKAPRPVYLEVKLSNAKAVRLYAKLGFTPTKVDPDADLMVMVKL